LNVSLLNPIDLGLLESLTRTAPIHEIPVDVLAYVGDAVYNLHCVVLSIGDGRKDVSKANRVASQWKSAKGQDQFLYSLLDCLTDEERAVVKRGRNSKGAKKRGNDQSYRNSTGFETLIGYLFLGKHNKRLQEVLDILTRFFSESDPLPLKTVQSGR